MVVWTKRALKVHGFLRLHLKFDHCFREFGGSPKIIEIYEYTHGHVPSFNSRLDQDRFLSIPGPCWKSTFVGVAGAKKTAGSNGILFGTRCLYSEYYPKIVKKVNMGIVDS